MHVTRSAFANLATGSLEVTLDSLLEAVDGHDTYTHGHSLRVSRSSAVIAGALGLDSDGVSLVRDVGLVHDIGKIAIPDALLRKTGMLTQQEFELLSLHPVLGASILARTPTLKHLVPGVLHHHERWDGRGYPAKLAGTEIPVESRIVFAADALDAMTTDRPYGTVFSFEDALAELDRYSGRQFDPGVVEALHDSIGVDMVHPGSKPSGPRAARRDHAVWSGLSFAERN